MSDKNERLSLISRLETQLHQRATRNDVRQVDTLLHDEFVEISRSGKRYNKAQTIAALAAEDGDANIQAFDFHLEMITEGVALLTYKSVQCDEAGTSSKFTLRSSVWQMSERTGLWELRFHQGTSTDE